MIPQLLDQIIKLDKSIQDKTNDYNIFQVLQLESEEVRLHSRFLADLLNPIGNHGLKTFFLKSFLEIVKEHTIFPDLNKVEVHIEKHVGMVTTTTGGLIDILLIDHLNNALIIENKIYAGDQPNQLLRYRNFGKQLESHGGKFHIIYLTLQGNSASDFSLGSDMKHEHYECLSYKHSILNWLENCTEQLKDNAKTSIILSHYIQLLKNLTGMENNIQQDLTIAEIMQSKEFFSAAEKITNALVPAKCKILKEAIEEVTLQLRLKFPQLSFGISDHFGYKYEGMVIHQLLPTETVYPPHIRFSFLSDASECYLEIHPGLVNGTPIDKNHKKRLQYIDVLKPNFPTTKGKMPNVEYYWQGEWVMYYTSFNNKFEQLLDTENRTTLLNQVSSDLQLIINAFLKAESEIDLRNN